MHTMAIYLCNGGHSSPSLSLSQGARPHVPGKCSFYGPLRSARTVPVQGLSTQPQAQQPCNTPSPRPGSHLCCNRHGLGMNSMCEAVMKLHRFVVAVSTWLGQLKQALSQLVSPHQDGQGQHVPVGSVGPFGSELAWPAAYCLLVPARLSVLVAPFVLLAARTGDFCVHGRCPVSQMPWLHSGGADRAERHCCHGQDGRVDISLYLS